MTFGNDHTFRDLNLSRRSNQSTSRCSYYIPRLADTGRNPKLTCVCHCNLHLRVLSERSQHCHSFQHVSWSFHRHPGIRYILSRLTQFLQKLNLGILSK